MSKLLASASMLAILAVAIAKPAAAQVLTFEDLAGCSGNNQPSVGIYDGVNFQHQFTCYSFAQTPYTPESNPNRIYAALDGANQSSGTFTFAPTSFSGAFFSGSANVWFTLYNGVNLVATSGTLSTTATPTFLSSGYNGTVDRVTVNGSSDSYVLDNVTFNGQSTVPEPSEFALLGTGLFGLVPMIRRGIKR